MKGKGGMFRKTFFLFFLQIVPLFSENYVTYDFSHGRFGDNVLTYLHAKWFSYQKGATLLYRPFWLSSQLQMHDKELHYEDCPASARVRMHIGRGPVASPPLLSIVYICPYFPEDKYELETGSYYSFSVDWKNEGFRKAVLETVAPKYPLSLTTPPRDVVSLAIHVREGGGYDTENIRWEAPLKLPPIHFYVDALRKVIELLGNRKIYCHVFTDALNPQEIVQKIEASLPFGADISFNWRKSNNRFDRNILEDFFSLLEFDILIRPQSNFSLVPSLIHDYAVVVSPKTFSLKNRVATIEEMQIEINEPLFQKLPL